jgi:hypothetical protein
MLTLASPAWLLGLLLVPAIRYLHRSGPILRRQPVASLDLWHDERALAARAGKLRPPDFAWLRRAAILTLLCLALAGPQWLRPAERVTLWIDDSLSMQTVEQGVTRLDRGLQLAQAALREAAVRDVLVRPLSQPARSFSSLDAATVASLRSGSGTAEPHLPTPATLAPSRSHWLVTDGADEALNAWLGDSAVDRVIQVAATAANVGITRVAVRAQPGRSSPGELQILLRNGGTVAETRTVVVEAGSATLASMPVAIAAGAAMTLTQAVPLPVPRVTVRLVPADALPLDDRAILDVTGLDPLAVHVDTSCPREVTRAVSTHPALTLARGMDAGLVIDCGAGWRRELHTPRIVLHEGPHQPLDAGAIAWSKALPGAPQRIVNFPPRVRGRLDAPRASDEVLLAAGGVPLIVRRGEPPYVVETSLDLGATELSGTETVPLLVAWLADAALDAALLDRIAALDRGATASMIAARGKLAARPRPTRATPLAAESFVLPLLLLAAILLAWDTLALLRQWLHARPRREPGNA